MAPAALVTSRYGGSGAVSPPRSEEGRGHRIAPPPRPGMVTARAPGRQAIDAGPCACTADRRGPGSRLRAAYGQAQLPAARCWPDDVPISRLESVARPAAWLAYCTWPLANDKKPNG